MSIHHIRYALHVSLGLTPNLLNTLQAKASSIATTTVAGLLFLALATFLLWLGAEKIVYRKYGGEKWLADILGRATGSTGSFFRDMLKGGQLLMDFSM